MDWNVYWPLGHVNPSLRFVAAVKACMKVFAASLFDDFSSTNQPRIEISCTINRTYSMIYQWECLFGPARWLVERNRWVFESCFKTHDWWETNDYVIVMCICMRSYIYIYFFHDWVILLSGDLIMTVKKKKMGWDGAEKNKYVRRWTMERCLCSNRLIDRMGAQRNIINEKRIASTKSKR